MPITYADLPGLPQHLEDNGYQVYRVDNDWFSRTLDNQSGPAVDTAVQNLIDTYNPLSYVREIKADEIKAEGLARISAVFPTLSNLDELKLEQERWLSIAPAARQASADYQLAIDIYVAARNAITTVNGEADWNVVNSYDVVSTPSWP